MVVAYKYKMVILYFEHFPRIPHTPPPSGSEEVDNSGDRVDNLFLSLVVQRHALVVGMRWVVGFLRFRHREELVRGLGVFQCINL